MIIIIKLKNKNKIKITVKLMRKTTLKKREKYHPPTPLLFTKVN